MSIISLQDALMSKVNTVEKLVKTTQMTKQKATELQERLEATEKAAAQSQARYEAMLTQEQKSTAILRGEVENLTRKEKMMQAELLKKDARIKKSVQNVNAAANESEVLKSDADTKRKEADMMEEQLENKSKKEGTMLATISTMEEQVGELQHKKW